MVAEGHRGTKRPFCRAATRRVQIIVCCPAAGLAQLACWATWVTLMARSRWRCGAAARSRPRPGGGRVLSTASQGHGAVHSARAEAMEFAVTPQTTAGVSKHRVPVCVGDHLARPQRIIDAHPPRPSPAGDQLIPQLPRWFQVGNQQPQGRTHYAAGRAWLGLSALAC